MAPIDYPSIERYAHELRAQELRRLETIAKERMGIYLHLLGSTMVHGLYLLGELVRPLFSWTPGQRRYH